MEAVADGGAMDAEPVLLPLSATARPLVSEETRERPPAAASEAERPISRGRRFTKGEIQLILEVYNAHRGEKWARMTEIYNEIAEQRGWFARATVTTFRSKCIRLLREMRFQAEINKDAAVVTCKRWEPAEDEALATWDRSVAFETQYEAFIAWMRETYDPSYFRTTRAIAGRLRFHARQTRSESAELSDGRRESEETESDDETADYRSCTPRAAVCTERSVSPKSHRKANLVALPPEVEVTEKDCGASLKECSRDERSTRNPVVRLGASSPSKVVGEAPPTEEEARADACDAAPVAVLASFAPTPLGLLASKLRGIQGIINTSDATLFRDASPLSEYRRQVLQQFHSHVGLMLDDALGTLYYVSNEIDKAMEHTRADFGYCLQKQSERFMIIMNAKAEAAEERLHQLQAQHQQERRALEEELWTLRSRCLELESCCACQHEGQRCRLERVGPPTSSFVQYDEGREKQVMSQTTTPCVPGQALDQRVCFVQPGHGHARPGHDAQKLNNYRASHVRSAPPFRGLSDQLFKQNQTGPSRRQQQLANVLAIADCGPSWYRVEEAAGEIA